MKRCSVLALDLLQNSIARKPARCWYGARTLMYRAYTSVLRAVKPCAYSSAARFAKGLLLLSILLLQGCIGAVVVGSAVVATKSTTDPRTVGTQLDDNTLQIRIGNALNKDQQLKKQTRVIATTYQGKVLLTGQAPTTELIHLAKQIAAGVEGVAEIYNEIRKGTPVDFRTISSDAWITTKVRSQLLAGDTVKSSHMKVATENGEVFLLGLLSQQEGQSAAKIASKISGVKKVITAFTYVQ